MNHLSQLTASYNLAVKRKSRVFSVPFHTFSYEIVKLLFDFGYFSSFYKIGPRVFIEVKYSEGKPVLRAMIRVSKSSKRVYTNNKPVHKKTFLITTSEESLIILSKGVRGTVGGEILLELV